jgi:hypothetical protein
VGDGLLGFGIEEGEQVLLDLEVLDDSLNDQVGVLYRFRPAITRDSAHTI